MALKNPIAAYNAESNSEALLVQRHLESHGIEAFATEDHSLVGYWMFGTLPEIHKPQVWVDQADVDRAAELLRDYERHKLERDAKRQPDNQPDKSATIEITCEDCGKACTFPSSLKGTVQDCPHCGSYVDVGEIDWPDDDIHEAETR